MDPEANLAEQLRIAARIGLDEHDESDVDRLAELVLALHEWIVGGGFLPARWTPPEDRKLSVVILAAVNLDRTQDSGRESDAHKKFRQTVERHARAKR